MREVFTVYNHHKVLEHNKKNFSTRITVKHEAVARRIAGILGGEVCDIDRMRTDRTGSDRNYVVPMNALSKNEAKRYGVRDADSVHGGIVFHPMQAEKGALHPPVSPDADVPPWYSRSFANRVVEAGTVFPGFCRFYRR